ncbi:MAG: amphi-Trp domain-containing protein [Pseudomonadota bacterium]
MSTDNFKHESLEDSESITKYLGALQDGFHNGSLVFSTDDRRFVIKPAGLINMEIDAKKKGEKVKITLRFRWNEAPGEPEPKPKTLSIEPLRNA